MYIRRKVFSLLNVEGEDRYFSTTDYIQYGEEVRLFSEDEEVRHRIKNVDKINMAVEKALTPKKLRKAAIEAYKDGATSKDRHNYGKEAAKFTGKVAGGVAATAAAAAGIAAGVIAKRSRLSAKEAAKIRC